MIKSSNYLKNIKKLIFLDSIIVLILSAAFGIGMFVDGLVPLERVIWLPLIPIIAVVTSSYRALFATSAGKYKKPDIKRALADDEIMRSIFFGSYLGIGICLFILLAVIYYSFQ